MESLKSHELGGVSNMNSSTLMGV